MKKLVELQGIKRDIVLSLLKSDKNSYSELASELGFTLNWIKRNVKKLEEMGIVYYKSKGYTYAFAVRKNRIRVKYAYEDLIKPLIPSILICMLAIIPSLIAKNYGIFVGAALVTIYQAAYTLFKVMKEGTMKRVFALVEEKEVNKVQPLVLKR